MFIVYLTHVVYSIYVVQVCDLCMKLNRCIVLLFCLFFSTYNYVQCVISSY